MTEDRIPDDLTQKKELKSIEDIWTIGYPNGLWDTTNNLPIIRESITATTPYIDYNGKREFLIDRKVISGSDGSPIIFYRDPYLDKDNYTESGPRLYLLGILSSNSQSTVQGNSKSTNPSSNVVPENLGLVIKASEILEFKKILIP